MIVGDAVVIVVACDGGLVIVQASEMLIYVFRRHRLVKKIVASAVFVAITVCRSHDNCKIATGNNIRQNIHM